MIRKVEHVSSSTYDDPRRAQEVYGEAFRRTFE